jgi:acyl-CoA synthetase (AMP-forming)/AMP-acid ligase II
VLSGGSAGVGRIREKWEALGVTFVETYGMSELGGAVALGYPRRFDSKPVKPFGKIPAIGPFLPGKEVKTADEQEKEVPPGVPGEIILRGGVMWGYWKMPRETAKTTRGGWLHTSDIGLIDELDNVYWLARKTDVIETASGAIYPRVIEEALFAHPSVRQACVVGLQEGEHEVPAGFVILFAGEKVSDDQLLDHCRSTLDRAFWPSKIVIKGSLPMTPTGKINKKELKND